MYILQTLYPSQVIHHRRCHPKAPPQSRFPPSHPPRSQAAATGRHRDPARPEGPNPAAQVTRAPQRRYAVISKRKVRVAPGHARGGKRISQLVSRYGCGPAQTFVHRQLGQSISLCTLFSAKRWGLHILASTCRQHGNTM